MNTIPPTDPMAARLQALERTGLAEHELAALEAALGDPSLVVRARAAIVAAEKLPASRLVELVSRGDNLARRAAAIDALVKAGPRALPDVVAGAQGPNRERARFCLQVLGRVGLPEARLVLREMAAHADRELRQTAFEALGVQRDREAVPLLVEALQGDPWIAFAAIWALGEIADTRACDALRKLREQKIFRDAADAALDRINFGRR